MQTFCGTDIIEINRIKEAIETLGEAFINKIYTENEIKYCESKKNVKYQHYAARFSAKEAIFKALSKVLDSKNLEWKNFEILNDENGRPNVNFVHSKIQELNKIDISISHCKEYATAVAIAEIYKED